MCLGTISQSQKFYIIYLNMDINVFLVEASAASGRSIYDNAADAFSVDDSVADDDLVLAVQHYENSTAQLDLSNNINNNNNSSSSSSNMDVGDQVYCPLTDDDIIAATPEFNILTKSCSLPLQQFNK